MADCTRCGHPVHDTGYLCHRCTADLRETLASVGKIAAETATTIARLARHGDGGHTTAERPLLFDWDAADAGWAAHNTITTWARHIAEQRGTPLPPRPAPGVEHPTARAATWLTGHLDWLRMRPEAAQALDELTDAAHLLRRTVDNPGVRWYAGPCHADPITPSEGERCPNELYAPPGATRVRCAACGAIHDADQRRAWLLQEARDQLLHAGWMASALSALGVTLPVGTIYSWASRSRLAAHGTDPNGRPLYRVGDALDLLQRGDGKAA